MHLFLIEKISLCCNGWCNRTVSRYWLEKVVSRVTHWKRLLLKTKNTASRLQKNNSPSIQQIKNVTCVLKTFNLLDDPPDNNIEVPNTVQAHIHLPKRTSNQMQNLQKIITESILETKTKTVPQNLTHIYIIYIYIW